MNVPLDASKHSSDKASIKFSLTLKGLLLVSVPLLFEVIFVGSLIQLLLHLEDALNRQTRSMAIVCRVNELVKTMYATVDSALTPGAVKQTAYVVSIPLLAESIKDAYKRLNKFKTAEDPELTERLRAFGTTVNQLGETLLDSAMTKTNSETVSLAMVFKVEPQIKLIFEQAQSITKPEQKKQLALTKEIEATKNRTIQVVELGVAINVLIALVLGFLFSTSITKRLRLLTENTRRLTAREKQLFTISGHDEVAYLGQRFVEMSQKLRQLEERKQEYLSMISHDVRTPITTIQTNLELLGKQAYGNVDETGLSKIETLSAQLDSLNLLVDQILTLDKLESGMLVLDKQNISTEVLVNNALESVRQNAQEREITILPQQTPTTVNVDKELLLSTLKQLLNLAIHDAHLGSQISITSESSDKIWSLQIEFAAQPLSDTVLKRLFDRYRQDSPTHKRQLLGSKLALALCKGLVRVHNGDLEAIGLPGDKIVLVLTLESVENSHEQ